MIPHTFAFIVAFASVFSIAADIPDGGGRNWPQWRGPGSRAISSTKGLPETWSETENINWKVPIAGVGYSQPAVWGNRIFVTTAIPQGQDVPEGDARRPRRQGPGGPPPTIPYSFVLYCLDRNTGKIVWERTARVAVPKEGVNRQKGSYANGTPATDGKHVYAFFGSQGLYYNDMAGTLKWERDFGDMEIFYMNGEGSSPAIHGDRVIIVWDDAKHSFITAVDKQTGKTLWVTERKEDRNFTSPVILEHEGRMYIVVNGANRVRAYDFKSGTEIWECGGQTECVIPTLVYGDAMVYATSGCIGQKAFKAIHLGWSGDITNTKAVVWSINNIMTPYVPSPLVYGAELYLVDDKGILSCYDAKTGKQNYPPTRIPDVFAATASLVAAEGKVYLLSEEGTMAVIKAGPKFELLHTNRINDRFLASPAIANGTIFLRGEHHLYSIGSKKN